MTPFGVYDDEMPNDPQVLDDTTIEAFLSGRTISADKLGPLACFAEDLRQAQKGPVPAPRADLAMLLSRGFSIEKGDLSATAASNVTGPAPQAAGLPKRRRAKMFVANILAGVAAKVALGVSVAAASVLGAGAAGVLPAAAQHAVASAVGAVTPIQLPDSTTSHAKPATKGDVASKGGTTTPGANTGGAVTGLDRANQTPAAGHVPTSVPGANTGGAVTGLNRANQTPAAGHVPTSLPGAATSGSATSGSATSGSSTSGSATSGSATSGSSSGLTQATNTPAAGHVPTSPGRP